jgi:hypothetical protein
MTYAENSVELIVRRMFRIPACSRRILFGAMLLLLVVALAIPIFLFRVINTTDSYDSQHIYPLSFQNLLVDIATNNGFPSVHCDYETCICQLANLCYNQDQSHREKMNLYTLGISVNKSQLAYNINNEFIRDIPPPSAIQVLNFSETKEFNISYITGNTFMFGRRYSNNIFHFLQKALPLYDIQKYYTIHNILFMIENGMSHWQSSVFNFVNRAYQQRKQLLFYTSQKQDQNKLVCIQNLVFPLLDCKVRPWPFYVTPKVMNYFSEDIVKSFNMEVYSRPPKTVTLIVRKKNRRIHNEQELYDALVNFHPFIQVRIVDYDKLTFKEQVDVMRTSGVVIAIHGAALTNSMFLPKHAAVIEIFPFGVYDVKKHDYARGMNEYTNYLHFKISNVTNMVLYKDVWSQESKIKCVEQLSNSWTECGSKFQWQADSIVPTDEFLAVYAKAIELISRRFNTERYTTYHR